MLTSYCPDAETYGIQVKLGPSAADVPTATAVTGTSSVVPAIFVTTSFSVQVPVRVVFEAPGAKQEALFWLAIADAKAPEERSWKI